MKSREEKKVDQAVEQHLKLFSAPPAQEIDDAKERTRRRLTMQPVGETAELPTASIVHRSPWMWRLGIAGAVAAAVLAVVFMPRGVDARAVVEAANGGLVSESGGRVIQVGERIEPGNAVRANGSGAMLKLADGSHIEMRAQSRLSLERAEDGVRIQLNDGDIIVNAEKQHGHLYVQTKDVKVSVVGTVFLVKREETGSRVAVIEGEVRVQEGAMEQRLRPGEQITTNSLAASRPVTEEVSWSRHAEEHFALLQQAPIPALRAPGSDPRDAFEVASVRASAPLPGAGPRGGGPVSSAERRGVCPGPNSFQIDPRRFVARRTNLYLLIALAYGDRCPASGTISGGPDWAASEKFDIEAVIPEGTTRYTKEQILNGSALQFQRMLQTLLADRFKLELRREMKEMSAYNLVVEKTGKLKLSENQSPDSPSQAEFPEGVSYYLIANVFSATTARFANNLQWDLGRPVFDKTGLKGLYDFLILFPDLSDQSPSLISDIRDELPRRLEEQLGLKLEPTKASVEVLVIDRVERPTEN